MGGMQNCADGSCPRAHAKPRDAAIISGYFGSSNRFDEAIASFAVTYTDQNERIIKRSWKQSVTAKFKSIKNNKSFHSLYSEGEFRYK